MMRAPKKISCAGLQHCLLTAKERFQLTQSSLDYITQQVQQMISFALGDAEKK